MVRILKPFVIIALLATGACGTVQPNIEMRFAGHLNHTRSAQVVERALDRDDPGPEAVYVIDAGTTPLDLSQYEILGSVRVDQHTDNEIGVRNWIWFNHFESPGRFGYCVWQTPLKMVTLGLWNIVPLAWPCSGGNPSDAAERLEYLSRYARRVAAEVGGDTVLMTESHSGTRMEHSGVAMTTGVGGSRGGAAFTPYAETTSVYEERNTGLTLLILRKLKPGTSAPQVDSRPQASAAHAKVTPPVAAPAPVVAPQPAAAPQPVAAPQPEQAPADDQPFIATPQPPPAPQPYSPPEPPAESPYGRRP